VESRFPEKKTMVLEPEGARPGCDKAPRRQERKSSLDFRIRKRSEQAREEFVVTNSRLKSQNSSKGSIFNNLIINKFG
jgi:hypothetical protein